VLIRLAAILFAVVLSARVVLPDEAVWVCRYTGQRVEPCACPDPRPPEQANLGSQGCCELRQHSHADLSGVVPGLEGRLPLLALEVPSLSPVPSPEPTGEPGARVRSGHDPPPRERLFLDLRQWLI
jgi:hypothetical protein